MAETEIIRQLPLWVQIIALVVSVGIGQVVFRFLDRWWTRSERKDVTDTTNQQLLFDTLSRELQGFRQINVDLNNQRVAEMQSNNDYHRQNDRNNYELLQELRVFMGTMADSNNAQTGVLTQEIKTQAEQIKAHINEKLNYLHGRLADNKTTGAQRYDRTDSGDP